MLDIPETLILLLTIVLAILWTRHWLSVNGLHRGGSPDKSRRG